MNMKTYLIAIFTAFITTAMMGQVTKDQAIVALDQLLNAQAHKDFKKALNESMLSIRDMTNVSVQDYNDLEYTYNVIEKMYNRVYLAEVKLDLTSFRQLKRLGRNPEKQSQRYQKHFFDILDYHENNFLPIYAQLVRQNSDFSGDIDPAVRDSLEIEFQRENLKSTRVNNVSSSINVVSSIFILFEGFQRMIAENKRAKQYLIRDFMSEANVAFDESKLADWASYDIYKPTANENNDYADNNDDYSEQRGQENSYEETPPTDLVGLPTISGQVHFEVFDPTSNTDRNMDIVQSEGIDVAVENYGDSGASFDLKIGRKKGSRSVEKKTTVSHFMTSEKYGAGTEFRVETSGNGFIYVFSINSGDKMFSIHPEIGEAADLSYGTYYPYAEGTRYEDEASGQMIVNIPGDDVYIEISNPEYGSIPNAETMVILFSKSQLDMRELFEKMEEMGPSLSPEERIAEIYGTMAASMIEGDVYMNDGEIYYYLDDNDPMVLPLVFNVRRK